MSIRKKNTLYRIYPKLTKRKLVKKLPRLALAFLGFLEPLFDLIVIPLGKNFNPKLNKEVISFYEDHFTALEEEELRTYPYVDLNEIKIYFVNDSSNLHEEGSTEYFSNILFKNKNDRVQLFFDNNERELNQVLGCLLYTSPSPRDRG